MRRIHVQIPAQPWAPFVARRIVRALCRTFALEHLSDDAEHVTSELVTAALSGHPAMLDCALAVLDGELRVDISCDDSCAGLHLVSEPAEWARGVLLVDAFSTTWGVGRNHGRRSLWFHLSASDEITLPDDLPVAAYAGAAPSLP